MSDAGRLPALARWNVVLTADGGFRFEASPKGGFVTVEDHEARVAALEKEISRLRREGIDADAGHAGSTLAKALDPFLSFANEFVDENGWNSPMSRTRVVDWFGPSDFRALVGIAHGLGRPRDRADPAAPSGSTS